MNLHPLPLGLEWFSPEDDVFIPQTTKKIVTNKVFGPYKMKSSKKTKIKDPAGKWIKQLSSCSTSDKSASNCLIFRYDGYIHLVVTKPLLPGTKLAVHVPEKQPDCPFSSSKNETTNACTLDNILKPTTSTSGSQKNCLDEVPISQPPKKSKKLKKRKEFEVEEFERETPVGEDTLTSVLEESPASTTGESNCTESESESHSKKDKAKKQRTEPKQERACVLCKQKFPHQRDLGKHIQMNHKIDGKVQCTKCKFSNAAYSFTRSHYLRKHAEAEDLKYPCTICGKKYPYKWTRNQHMKKHGDTDTEENARERNCVLCNEQLETKGDLAKHTKVAHRFGDQIQCTKCDFSHQMSQRVKMHYLRMHVEPGERRFSCKLCQKRFISNWALRRHQRLHSGTLFKCEICGKEYKKKDAHASHTDKCANSDLKRFPCDECDEKFLNSFHRSHHRRIVHLGEDTISCSECTKIFVTQEALQKHTKRRHTAEQQILYEFPCGDCGKICNSMYKLLRHEANQHGLELPKPCGYCDEAFIDNSQLTRHLKKHKSDGLLLKGKVTSLRKLKRAGVLE